MNKTALFVVSGSWEGGLMSCYRRAFQASGFGVEEFDLEGTRRALFPAPRAFDPVVNRILGHLDIPSFNQRADRALVMAATKLDPALVVVSCNEPIRAATLVQLRIALPRAKLVNIYPDTLFNMRDNVVQNLPLYDLFCTHTRVGIPSLERLGCRSPLYVPLAADPTVHRPFSLTAEEQREYGCEVVYVGNWRPDHEALFARLEGIDLDIWGSTLWAGARNAWVRSRWRGRPLHNGEDYSKAHIAAKVCLNPIDALNMPGHNQRVFELPACRVFSLVSRSEDVTEIFREGESVACFSSPDEMVEQTRRYLALPDDRRRIAEAAYRLVVEGGHTYRDRVGMILERLGIAA